MGIRPFIIHINLGGVLKITPVWKVRFIQLRSYSQYYIENYYTLTLRLIEIIVL